MEIRSWALELMALSPAEIRARLEVVKARIFPLPEAEAEREVMAWLSNPADPAFPSVLQNADGAPDSDRLPPGVARFLSRYSILDTGGDTRISHEELRPMDDGVHVVIGHASDALIVAARDSERIWFLQPLDLEDGTWPTPYPSLWHLLLVERATVLPGWWRVDRREG